MSGHYCTSQAKCFLDVQQAQGQHFVYPSERMAHPQGPTPTRSAPAERQFMQSVTIPLHVSSPTVDPKRSMTEFKIDYQIRRDSRGKEIVYKVYLPTKHKGWAITAETKNATSPEVEESSPDTFRSERPRKTHQRSSLQVPTKRKPREQKAGDPLRLNKFNKVNGVVSPSLLKPGQSPIRSPFVSRKGHSVGSRAKDKRCPICGDGFRMPCELKPHFVVCVRRNGNPQGFYWDGTLNENEECRIGRAIAELYCTRDGGGDLDSGTSTSDKNSDHGYHTSSYEPSVSRSDSQSSSSPSRAVTPNKRHHCNHCTGASFQSRTSTDHDEGNGVSEMGDKQIADRSLEITQTSVAGQAEAFPKTGQAQPSDQLRDLQAPTLPLGHEANIRAWDWNTTPETPTQRRSKANIVVASGHNNIHGDFDAVNITTKTTMPTPKTTVPTPITSGPNTAGNTYYFPTPLTAKTFSAGRPPGQPSAFPSAGLDAVRSVYCFPTPRTAEDSSAGRPLGRSPAFLVFSSTSPVNNANRPTQRPSPLSGAQKRQSALEPSPLTPDPKRQRISSPFPTDLPQAKTAADPPHHCEKQWPRFLPVTPAGTTATLSRNGPTSTEKIAVDRVSVRQSKAPSLRINTQAAALATLLPSSTEPTHVDQLYADFIRTHHALRIELDNLTHKLHTANNRAKDAESRARKAENTTYQANNAHFQKLKELGDKHRVEMQSMVGKHQTLEINLENQRRRYRVLEARCEDLKWVIGKVKGEMGEERLGRMFAAVFGEDTETA